MRGMPYNMDIEGITNAFDISLYHAHDMSNNMSLVLFVYIYIINWMIPLVYSGIKKVVDFSWWG